MNKMYAIFEHELAVCQNLPYMSIFELEPFREYLFEEFLLTERKPCFWLYHEQYYSQEEWEKMRDEMNAEIPAYSGNESIAAPTIPFSKYDISLNLIYLEFIEKHTNNDLDQQFFCPDILNTPTALILSKIDEALDYLKVPDFNNERLVLYVEIISDDLKAISKVDLRKKILEKLTDDDLNYKAILQEDNGVSLKKWQKNKFEFNHLIKNVFSNQEQSANLDKQDHSKLFVELNKYITGISAKEFTNIIQYHSTTPGTPPAIWKGEKVDACYFCDEIEMAYSKWSKLFCFPDGKKLHAKYKDKNNRQFTPILKILRSHLKK